MAATKLKYAKLTGDESFARWKRVLELGLNDPDVDLLGVIDGTRNEPAKPTDSSTQAVKDSYSKWKKNNGRALRTIFETIDDSNFEHVKAYTSAKSAFEKLCAVYN